MPLSRGEEERLKQYVRDFYGNVCLLCEIRQQYLPRKLDVHHIDGNHNNNDFENLAPLCKEHHDLMRKSRKARLQLIQKIKDELHDRKIFNIILCS